MKKKLVYGLLVVVMIHVVLLFGLYWWSWTLGYSVALASRLGLPLAAINGEQVRLADYLVDVQALGRGSETAALTEQERRKAAWSKIQTESIIRAMSREKGIQPKAAEIEVMRQRVTAQLQAEGRNGEQISQVFGYSDNMLIQRLLEPLYLEEQLRKHYILKEDSTERTQIQQIKSRLETDPTLFEDLRNEIDPDGSALEHLLPVEDLVGDYAHLAELKPGEISRVMAMSDGYRLYRLRDIISDQGKTLYQLDELFLPSTFFDRVLDQALEQKEEKIYIPNLL